MSDDIFVWTHEWTPAIKVTLDYDHYERGRDYLAYKLEDNGQVIFQGNKFCRAPMTKDCLSEKSVMHLLDFLTLQKGDTDQEYFSEYTQDQLDWIESDNAEDLRLIACDYEEGKNE